MKPTILILLAALAVSGCTLTPTAPMVVTEVGVAHFTDKKYYVKVNETTTMYTDSLYKLGDTIK